MTVEQFLLWEERQELRYEFDGIPPIPIHGGTASHAAVCRNILFSLTGRLRGTVGIPYGDTLKISVGGRIRYPDAFVVRTQLPGQTTVVAEPVVVFEVLSPSSLKVDLIDKNREYRDTPSVERYVILDQTRAGAIMFVRRGADWAAEIASGEDAVLAMPEIGIEVPLAELHIGVEVGPDEV